MWGGALKMLLCINSAVAINERSNGGRWPEPLRLCHFLESLDPVRRISVVLFFELIGQIHVISYGLPAFRRAALAL